MTCRRCRKLCVLSQEHMAETSGPKDSCIGLSVWDYWWSCKGCVKLGMNVCLHAVIWLCLFGQGYRMSYWHLTGFFFCRTKSPVNPRSDFINPPMDICIFEYTESRAGTRTYLHKGLSFFTHHLFPKINKISLQSYSYKMLDQQSKAKTFSICYHKRNVLA